MAFTSELVQDHLADVGSTVATTIALFNRLRVDDRLAVLWDVYTETECAITPIALGSARLQFTEGLIAHFQRMSHDDQLQAMRDLANRVNTPISRSYGVLSANTKLGLWYLLAELMAQGLVTPMPIGYQSSQEATTLLDIIKSLDISEQITMLRSVVSSMGVDPLI